jgi:hypothetical protein
MSTNQVQRQAEMTPEVERVLEDNRKAIESAQKWLAYLDRHGDRSTRIFERAIRRLRENL